MGTPCLCCTDEIKCESTISNVRFDHDRYNYTENKILTLIEVNTQIFRQVEDSDFRKQSEVTNFYTDNIPVACNLSFEDLQSREIIVGNLINPRTETIKTVTKITRRFAALYQIDDVFDWDKENKFGTKLINKKFVRGGSGPADRSGEYKDVDPPSPVKIPGAGEGNSANCSGVFYVVAAEESDAPTTLRDFDSLKRDANSYPFDHKDQSEVEIKYEDVNENGSYLVLVECPEEGSLVEWGVWRNVLVKRKFNGIEPDEIFATGNAFIELRRIIGAYSHESAGFNAANNPSSAHMLTSYDKRDCEPGPDLIEDIDQEYKDDEGYILIGETNMITNEIISTKSLNHSWRTHFIRTAEGEYESKETYMDNEFLFTTNSIASFFLHQYDFFVHGGNLEIDIFRPKINNKKSGRKIHYFNALFELSFEGEQKYIYDLTPGRCVETQDGTVGNIDLVDDPYNFDVSEDQEILLYTPEYVAGQRSTYGSSASTTGNSVAKGQRFYSHYFAHKSSSFRNKYKRRFKYNILNGNDRFGTDYIIGDFVSNYDEGEEPAPLEDWNRFTGGFDDSDIENIDKNCPIFLEGTGDIQGRKVNSIDRDTQLSTPIDHIYLRKNVLESPSAYVPKLNSGSRRVPFDSYDLYEGVPHYDKYEPAKFKFKMGEEITFYPFKLAINHINPNCGRECAGVDHGAEWAVLSSEFGEVGDNSPLYNQRVEGYFGCETVLNHQKEAKKWFGKVYQKHGVNTTMANYKADFEEAFEFPSSILVSGGGLGPPLSNSLYVASAVRIINGQQYGLAYDNLPRDLCGDRIFIDRSFQSIGGLEKCVIGPENSTQCATYLKYICNGGNEVEGYGISNHRVNFANYWGLTERDVFFSHSPRPMEIRAYYSQMPPSVNAMFSNEFLANPVFLKSEIESFEQPEFDNQYGENHSIELRKLKIKQAISLESSDFGRNLPDELDTLLYHGSLRYLTSPFVDLCDYVVGYHSQFAVDEYANKIKEEYTFTLDHGAEEYYFSGAGLLAELTLADSEKSLYELMQGFDEDTVFDETNLLYLKNNSLFRCKCQLYTPLVDEILADFKDVNKDRIIESGFNSFSREVRKILNISGNGVEGVDDPIPKDEGGDFLMDQVQKYWYGLSEDVFLDDGENIVPINWNLNNSTVIKKLVEDDASVGINDAILVIKTGEAERQVLSPIAGRVDFAVDVGDEVQENSLLANIIPELKYPKGSYFFIDHEGNSEGPFDSANISKCRGERAVLRDEVVLDIDGIFSHNPCLPDEELTSLYETLRSFSTLTELFIVNSWESEGYDWGIEVSDNFAPSLPTYVSTNLHYKKIYNTPEGIEDEDNISTTGGSVEYFSDCRFGCDFDDVGPDQRGPYTSHDLVIGSYETEDVGMKTLFGASFFSSFKALPNIYNYEIPTKKFDELTVNHFNSAGDLYNVYRKNASDFGTDLIEQEWFDVYGSTEDPDRPGLPFMPEEPIELKYGYRTGSAPFNFEYRKGEEEKSGICISYGYSGFEDFLYTADPTTSVDSVGVLFRNEGFNNVQLANADSALYKFGYKSIVNSKGRALASSDNRAIPKIFVPKLIYEKIVDLKEFKNNPQEGETRLPELEFTHVDITGIRGSTSAGSKRLFLQKKDFDGIEAGLPLALVTKKMSFEEQKYPFIMHRDDRATLEDALGELINYSDLQHPFPDDVVGFRGTMASAFPNYNQVKELLESQAEGLGKLADNIDVETRGIVENYTEKFARAYSLFNEFCYGTLPGPMLEGSAPLAQVGGQGFFTFQNSQFRTFFQMLNISQLGYNGVGSGGNDLNNTCLTGSVDDLTLAPFFGPFGPNGTIDPLFSPFLSLFPNVCNPPELGVNEDGEFSGGASVCNGYQTIRRAWEASLSIPIPKENSSFFPPCPPANSRGCAGTLSGASYDFTGDCMKKFIFNYDFIANRAGCTLPADFCTPEARFTHMLPRITKLIPREDLSDYGVYLSTAAFLTMPDRFDKVKVPTEYNFYDAFDSLFRISPDKNIYNAATAQIPLLDGTYLSPTNAQNFCMTGTGFPFKSDQEILVPDPSFLVTREREIVGLEEYKFTLGDANGKV